MTSLPQTHSGSRLRPYPAYKDSGVEWLGRIPEHWRLSQLRHAIDGIKNGTTATQVETGTTEYWVTRIETISRGVIDYQKVGYVERSNALEGYRLEVGDILLSHINSLEMVGNCAIYDGRFPLYSGMNLLRIRPSKGVISLFLWNWLRSALLRQNIQAVAKHAINQVSVPVGSISALPVVWPPPEEQQSIASFLDRETGKIDGLVKKMEGLIELLQEKRTALISHAVTQGLDPNAPKKDSGIPWLGRIPKHWEVKRMKFLASQPLTYGANESAESDDPSQPRFIRITDIKSDGSLHDDTFRSLPEDLARRYLLQQGDLLLARSGATVGKTFMYRESWGRACHAGYLIRCRLNSAVAKPEYISLYATSAAFWAWLSSVFIQATIQNVSAEKYSDLPVPLPPLREQQAISNYLDSETAKLDALMAKVRAAIDRLQEYRTALISAAVTGQIDVRARAV